MHTTWHFFISRSSFNSVISSLCSTFAVSDLGCSPVEFCKVFYSFFLFSYRYLVIWLFHFYILRDLHCIVELLFKLSIFYMFQVFQSSSVLFSAISFSRLFHSLFCLYIQASMVFLCFVCKLALILVFYHFPSYFYVHCFFTLKLICHYSLNYYRFFFTFQCSFVCFSMSFPCIYFLTSISSYIIDGFDVFFIKVDMMVWFPSTCLGYIQVNLRILLCLLCTHYIHVFDCYYIT